MVESLGVTQEQIKEFLKPFIAEMIKEILNEMKLGEIISTSLEALGKKLSQEIKEELVRRTTIEGAPGSGVQPNEAKLHPVTEALLSKILGVGTAPVAGLEQMTKMSELVSTFMTPFLDIYQRGRKDLLDQLTLMSRLGVQTPLETIQAPHRRPVAEQAREMAKKIKLNE